MSILALTSNTLIATAAAGNVEYNGQFFGTDSNASRAQLQRITSGTAVASTSGTSIDFTSIPSWVKRITVMFNGVSTSGTSNVLVQIGSGSVSATGYLSSVASIDAGAGQAGSTVGIIVTNALPAARTFNGAIILSLIGSNTWVANGSANYSTSTGALFAYGGISPALAGALDRVRLTTTNGTDTFDAGSVNILYEG
jgi:hypothetical protein